jgi:hypothetical protein
MKIRHGILGAWLTLVAVFMNACGPIFTPASGPAEGGWIDWDGRSGWTGSEGSADELLFAAGESEFALEEAPADLAAPIPAPASSEGESTSSRSAAQGPNLRAGSVDDNAAWDDYLLYRMRFAEWGIPVHDLDIHERHSIQVRNPDGAPILGASIGVYDEQGELVTQMRTHADGGAAFFPAVYRAPSGQSFRLEIEKGDVTASAVIDRSDREHDVILDAEPAGQPVRLDVHFLIDATGSMSDEIQQLKDNMISVSERIAALPSAPNVRFGMTVYRDRGDLFVSRTLDFSSNVETFIDELGQVVAEGGGDYPESLNEGLHNALYLPEWRVEDSVSLVFLIADAPPHLDYGNDFDYAEDVLAAVELGIKIYPLASSGLDDQGEYIFRQLAQITRAKFLFLTYGADGAPGEDTPHHVEDYSVLSLDELVVRIVEEELANLTPRQ